MKRLSVIKKLLFLGCCTSYVVNSFKCELTRLEIFFPFYHSKSSWFILKIIFQYFNCRRQVYNFLCTEKQNQIYQLKNSFSNYWKVRYFIITMLQLPCNMPGNNPLQLLTFGLEHLYCIQLNTWIKLLPKGQVAAVYLGMFLKTFYSPVNFTHFCAQISKATVDKTDTEGFALENVILQLLVFQTLGCFSF